VASVVLRARAHLNVLVVDDGSRDDTADKAESAGAVVLRQVPNQGKGAALRAGFTWAIQNHAAAVVTLDADGQHDPAEIPSFLAAYTATQSDLIIGERNFKSMPWVRKLSNAVGRRVFSWAMGRHISDNQSGYRLLSRRLMEALLQSPEQGFEFEMEMIAVAVERGFSISGVPIRTIYAGEKSHIRPIPHVIHFFRVAFATRKRMAKTSKTAKA
jgi:glycosyltransferase involved in cell wall biosynthesis